MALLQRRSKMISFRISEDEYHHLVGLCVSHGVRSLSDLARDAIHALLRPANPQLSGRGFHPTEAEFSDLHGRLITLDGEVKRLTSLVDHAQ